LAIIIVHGNIWNISQPLPEYIYANWLAVRGWKHFSQRTCLFANHCFRSNVVQTVFICQKYDGKHLGIILWIL